MSLVAQAPVNLRQADQLYQMQGYHAAAVLYEQTDDDQLALERLANSYRLIHDTEKAEPLYAKLVEKSDHPAHLLHYAQMLHSNGKLDLAKKYYLLYDAVFSGGGDRRGIRMARAIEQLTLAENAGVLFENARVLNSDKSEFSPVFYDDGLVFVSTRNAADPSGPATARRDKWTGDEYSALYRADFQSDGSISTPVAFATGLNTKFHEGPLTFTNNGNGLLYTRNVGPTKKSAGGGSFLKIATAVKMGNRWLRDDLLDLGGEDCNDVHPAVSPNGEQLFFASDRPGGYGGMDLYVTTFSNGHWGHPVNLGPTINTAGNEVFPFFYDDGTLYFASDGWGGFGGLDIFYAQPDLYGDWEQAANLGLPFNSPKDDFGYILNLTGTEGYLSSARTGGLGKDDLYHFILTKPQSNKLNHFPNTSLCVVDEADDQPVSGAVVSVFSQNEKGEYLGYVQGQMVKWIADRNGKFVRENIFTDPFAPAEPLNGEMTTDKNGQLNLYLSDTMTYLVQVSLAGYEDRRHLLEKGGKKDCITLKPVHCSYLRGQVVDKLSGKLIAGAQLTLLNLTTKDEISSTTDDSGQYRVCVNNNCDFIIKAWKENYSEDHALVSTFQAEGKSGLVYQDLQLNAVAGKKEKHVGPKDTGYLVELDQIYYDYGLARIRPDAARELDQIALFLQRNPQLSIELRSHTDSRGDAAYNKELSQQRAVAAADYLIEKGIAVDRVTALGKGEEQLLNDCVDGKECSEEEHQVNRRTEVRFFEK